MFDIRKKGRMLRRNIEKDIHSQYSQKICQKIQEFITDKKVVMLYNAIDGEVDVSKIINMKDKIFLFPRVEGENIVPVLGKNFKIGAYGINEPIGDKYSDKIDAVIVPMCAYDKNLNRIGSGKGYYDRFLANQNCLKIGVAFSCQFSENIIVKENDVPMDIIITEKEILEA